MTQLQAFTSFMISPRALGTTLVLACLTGTHLTGCSEPMSDSDHLAQAQEQFNSGDVSASIIELKNALTINPENIEARLLLGKSYLLQSNGAAAEEQLNAAKDMGATAEASSVALAEALFLQAKYQVLVDEIRIEEGMSDDTMTSISVYRGRALLMLDRGREAFLELRVALESDENSPTAWLGQAYMEYSRGKWQKASDWLEKVLEQEPELPEALALRGNVASQLEEHETAVSAFAQALEQRPYNLVYRLSLAGEYMTLGDVESALKEVDKVKQYAPNHPVANLLLAQAAYQSKNYQEARDYAEAVLSFAPDHPQSLLIAGTSHYFLGSYEQANTHISHFTTQIPDHQPALKLLAATQMQLGLPKQALATVGPIELQGADEASLASAIGSSNLSGGDSELSLQLLRTAVDLNPDDPPTNARYGMALVKQGQVEAGVKYLQKARALAPEQIEFALALTMVYIQAKDYDAALTSAKHLQEVHPDAPEGYNLAGIAYSVLGESANAEAEFVKATTVEPGDSSANTNLARLAAARGDFEEARKRYEDILAQHDGDPAALLNLARLDVQSGDMKTARSRLEEAVQKNPDSTEASLSLANLYLQAGQPSRALEALAPHQDKEPQNASVLELTGRAQMASGDPGGARITLEQLVAMNPSGPAPHLHLAKAYIQLGKLGLAQRELDIALAIDPKHSPSRFALAQLLTLKGQMEEAKSLLKDLRQTFPDSSLIPELEGDIALAQEQPKLAVRYFEEAWQVHESSLLVIKLARAQWQSGDHPLALTTLEQWLEKNPKDIAARNALATSLLSLAQYEDARQQYLILDELSPDSVLVLNNLAWTLYSLGEAGDALPYSEAAFALAPENATVLDTHSKILMATGQQTEALSILQNAAAMSPQNPMLQWLLAQALVPTSRKEEAKGIIEELLQTAPDFSEREAAEALLAELDTR